MSGERGSTVGQNSSRFGALRSFDLAVQVRRTWFDGAEFNCPVHKPLLHLFSKEFQAAVALNALDWKRHLLDQSFQEIQSVGGGPAGIDAEDSVS